MASGNEKASVHTLFPPYPVQGRLWLTGARMTADLRLLKDLEWHLKYPAVLTQGLRVLLSWCGRDSLIEEAAIRTKVMEGAHWPGSVRAEIRSGHLLGTPQAGKF